MSRSDQYDPEALELLERSIRQLGQIYSVIVDTDGEILAGRHRLKAGATKQTTVDTQKIAERLGIFREMSKLMIILHSNVQRKVSKEETREIILRMAKELEKQGVPKENIASELYNKYVPFSKSYILELLPEEYKKTKHAPKKTEELPLVEVSQMPKENLTYVKPATEEQINKIKELYPRVYGVEVPDHLLATLDEKTAEIILEEMEEARKLIEEGRASRIYLKFGGEVMVEVDRDYALEYIERRILALKAAIKGN